MLAARVPTRRRSWRCVVSRAAVICRKTVGSAQLLLLSSSLPVVPITITCKKNTNATTSCPLSFSVFGFRSASVSSLGSVPFLCVISSLSQVAGKEGEWTRGKNGGWEGGWLLWRPICGEMKERTGMAGRSRSGSWFRSMGCWVCRVGRNCHRWGRLKEKRLDLQAPAVVGRSCCCCGACWRPALMERPVCVQLSGSREFCWWLREGEGEGDRLLLWWAPFVEGWRRWGREDEGRSWLSAKEARESLVFVCLAEGSGLLADVHDGCRRKDLLVEGGRGSEEMGMTLPSSGRRRWGCSWKRGDEENRLVKFFGRRRGEESLCAERAGLFGREWE